MKRESAQKRREGRADSHLHQSVCETSPQRHAHRWAVPEDECKEEGGGPEVASDRRLGWVPW